MSPRLRVLVRRRAHFRCEYCHFPERFAELHFQIDHITARQHRGPTKADNLAFACFRCNSHKGPNLSGVDPATGSLERLFNPRLDRWTEHFRWKRAVLIGGTPVGRATVAVLNINRADVLLLRATLMEEGVRF